MGDPPSKTTAPDSDLTRRYTFTHTGHHDWHHFTYDADWTQLLAAYKGKSDTNFMEVGVFEGRTTLWLMENILTSETSRLTAVDTFEGSEEHGRLAKDHLLNAFKSNLSSHLGRIDIVQADSSMALLRLQEEERRYDFIYIDASHRPEDAVMDGWLAWPLLKPGGFLIFDDYTWAWRNPVTMEAFAPKRGIDKFLLLITGQYLEIYRRDQLALQKLAIGTGNSPSD